MTKREMFEAIVNGNITEEVIAMCQKELDRGAEARAAKSAEQTAVNEAVAAVLSQTEVPITASEIAASCEYTTGKVVAALKRLKADGKVAVIEGKVNSYKLA